VDIHTAGNFYPHFAGNINIRVHAGLNEIYTLGDVRESEFTVFVGIKAVENDLGVPDDNFNIIVDWPP
jgi:hypothetical protein